jgi:hypothetical protein
VTKAAASKQSPKRRKTSRNMISVHRPWIECPSGKTLNKIRTLMKPQPDFNQKMPLPISGLANGIAHALSMSINGLIGIFNS